MGHDFEASLDKRTNGAHLLARKLEAASALAWRLHRRISLSRQTPAAKHVVPRLDRWLEPCDEIRDFGFFRDEHEALTARLTAIRQMHDWPVVDRWGRKAEDNVALVITLYHDRSNYWKKNRQMLVDALVDPDSLNAGNTTYTVKGRDTPLEFSEGDKRSDVLEMLEHFRPPRVKSFDDFDPMDVCRPPRLGRLLADGLRVDREIYLERGSRSGAMGKLESADERPSYNGDGNSRMWITVAEAAKAADRDESTIRRWRLDGKLRVNDHQRIDADDLQRKLNSGELGG